MVGGTKDSVEDNRNAIKVLRILIEPDHPHMAIIAIEVLVSYLFLASIPGRISWENTFSGPGIEANLLYAKLEAAANVKSLQIHPFF